MYNYEYVAKSEWLPVRNRLEELIHEVQERMKKDGYFTFSYRFIGSSSRNMITCDYSQNKGFDFDVDLAPNDDDENYSPEQIKRIFMHYFNKVASRYRYNSYCEDSTRVITLKFVDRENSRIVHSVDFAIVYNPGNGQITQYIHYNKKQNSYEWQSRRSGSGVEKKAEWICKNGHKGELEDVYLDKKNANEDPNKRSRSLYAEAVSEVYNYHHK